MAHNCNPCTKKVGRLIRSPRSSLATYTGTIYLLSRNAEPLPSAASLCYFRAHYTLSALKNVCLALGLEAGYHTALVDFKLMTSCLSLPKAMMMRMFPPYPALCLTPPPPHPTPAFFEIGSHSIAQVGLEPTMLLGQGLWASWPQSVKGQDNRFAPLSQSSEQPWLLGRIYKSLLNLG